VQFAALVLAVLWTGQLPAATVAILDTASHSAAFSEAVFRLKGELLAVGLEVEIEPRPTAAANLRTALQTLSRERQLVAIVDVVGEASIALEIWFFQPSLQRFESVRVEPDPGAASTSANLAIRAVEVIRSNLAERGLLSPKPALDTPDPRSDSAPSPSPPHPPAGGHPWLALEGGAGLLASWQGVGAAFMPLVRVDWAVGGALVQVTAAGFGTRPTIESEAGSAEVAQFYGVLGVRHCILCNSSLQPFAGVGLGLMQTSIEGNADAPLSAHGVSQTSFLMEGSLGVAPHLAGPCFLTFAAHVQLAVPYVAVHFADRMVATTGRPNGALSLTLGAWL